MKSVFYKEEINPHKYKTLFTIVILNFKITFILKIIIIISNTNLLIIIILNINLLIILIYN